MNKRAMWAIIRKDLKVALKNRGVLMPLIILPLLFLVVIPAGVGLAPSMVNMSGASPSDMEAYVARMPSALVAETAGMSQPQMMIVLMLLYFMVPLYMIVPLMVASVIAADSFAGEKERKTLEALLYTPTTDRELFQAKLLSAWIPAVAVAWIGFVLYGVVANAAAWPVMGRIFFPNAAWLVLAFWVAPAIAGMGLGATVLVSARAQGFQDAYQFGGILVLPIVGLVVSQASGVMYFSAGLVALIGLAIWLIDAALIWFGVKTFQRSEIIARL